MDRTIVFQVNLSKGTFTPHLLRSPFFLLCHAGLVVCSNRKCTLNECQLFFSQSSAKMWSDQLHITLDAPLSIEQSIWMKTLPERCLVLESSCVCSFVGTKWYCTEKGNLFWLQLQSSDRHVISYEGESMMMVGRRSSCFEFFNLIFVEIRSKEWSSHVYKGFNMIEILGGSKNIKDSSTNGAFLQLCSL